MNVGVYGRNIVFVFGHFFGLYIMVIFAQSIGCLKCVYCGMVPNGHWNYVIYELSSNSFSIKIIQFKFQVFTLLVFMVYPIPISILLFQQCHTVEWTMHQMLLEESFKITRFVAPHNAYNCNQHLVFYLLLNIGN